MTSPVISIVTVTYNAAHHLPLTLESVIAQDYSRTEVLVFDGESWDNTAGVISRYSSDIDKIFSGEDAGIYYAMNRAAEVASGDYIIFMNAGDQFFSADAISRIVEGLHGRPDVFYGKHVYVHGRLEKLQRSAHFGWLVRQLQSGTIDESWLEAIPGHQATFTSLKLLREMPYDTRLKVAADHDLMFRAYAAGARFQYVDEIVAHYHAGGFSGLMGERTRLEGASVYRRYSDDPASVDRFFYIGGSPFDPRTARAGTKISGFIPLVDMEGVNHFDPDLHGDAVGSSGATVRAPSPGSRGISISGYTTEPEQALDIWNGDQLLASATLLGGRFRLHLTFAFELREAALLTFRARHQEEVHPPVPSAIIVNGFEFWKEHYQPWRLATGSSVTFGSGVDEAGEILNSGWSASEQAHTWSLGGESDLRMAADPSTRMLQLEVSGNPHVAGGRQTLKVDLNGHLVQEVQIDDGERATIEIQCDDGIWSPGESNHIIFRTLEYAAPPEGSGDTRLLGICLWKITAL